MDENFLLNLETCSLCLELIDEKDIYKCINCKQYFHNFCIKRYLKNKKINKCINCKFIIIDINIDDIVLDQKESYYIGNDLNFLNNNNIETVYYNDLYETIKGFFLLMFILVIFIIVIVLVYNSSKKN